MEHFTYEDKSTKDAVGAVIFNCTGKILIFNHKKLGLYTIPIGKVEPGKSIEDVMRKEVFDETNLEVCCSEKIIEVVGSYDYEGIITTIKTHIFEIISYKGEPRNKESEKHNSMNFMSTDEIKNLPKISDATIALLEYRLNMLERKELIKLIRHRTKNSTILNVSGIYYIKDSIYKKNFQKVRCVGV